MKDSNPQPEDASATPEAVDHDDTRLTLLGLMTVAHQQYAALRATEDAICRLMKVPVRSELPDYGTTAYERLSKREKDGAEHVGDVIYTDDGTALDAASRLVDRIGMPK